MFLNVVIMMKLIYINYSVIAINKMQ